jgi:hypothetical protein
MPATVMAGAGLDFARTEQLDRFPDSQIWLLAGGVEQARADGEGGGGGP